jgi:hypothetical protein
MVRTPKDEQRIANMKLKEKSPRQRPISRWEQRIRKDVTQNKGRIWKKLRRKCGNTEADRGSWLSDDSQQWKHLRKKI